jgi:hypothetical protein
LPGKTFHGQATFGQATFSWLESGAFLLFHSPIDEPEIPDGVAILGTDDATPRAGTRLYFDVRNVSREYRGTMSGNSDWIRARLRPSLLWLSASPTRLATRFRRDG